MGGVRGSKKGPKSAKISDSPLLHLEVDKMDILQLIMAYSDLLDVYDDNGGGGMVCKLVEALKPPVALCLFQNCFRI